MESIQPPRRADGICRWDKLVPTVGGLAASMGGLLLIETVCFEFVVPYLVPTLESMYIAYGKFLFLFLSGLLVGGTGFWGVGTLFALPAIFGSTSWKIQPSRDLDVRKLLEAIPLIFFNFLIAVCLVPSILLALPNQSFDWQNLPSKAHLARDILVWFVVEETMFFYLHRWLHVNKYMYQAVHKLHHTWTAPVSYVAMYCHPLEQVMCNILPLVLGPVLCGSHVAATGIYFFTGMVHTTAVHSGYWFCDDNGMHDEHHAKFTVNYGVTGVLDVLHGTYRLPLGATGKSADATDPASAKTAQMPAEKPADKHE